MLKRVSTWPIAALLNQEEKPQLKKGHKTEEAINTIDDQLTKYLIRLSSEALVQKKVIT